MKRSFEELLIDHCAPTLAGVKTANLFCCDLPKAEILKKIAYWNDQLSASGVKLTVLRDCPVAESMLVYIYREKKLKEDLGKPGVGEYLKTLGYKCRETLDHLISILREKLARGGDFPHEIGLFLGYPFPDVLGFITNKGQNFCEIGCWKVYDNPEEAQKRFERYRKCVHLYRIQYGKGKSIRQLTVAA